MALGLPLTLLFLTIVGIFIAIIVICFIAGIGTIGTGVIVSAVDKKSQVKGTKFLSRVFIILGSIIFIGVIGIIISIVINIMSAVSFNKNSLISHALSEDGYDIVKEEIANGVFVDSNYNMFKGNYPAKEGKDTPLTALCSSNKHTDVDYNIVKLLIESGADVNHIGDNGKTPILSAAENRHHSIVALLIENGADIYAKDANGATVPMLESVDNGAPSESEMKYCSDNIIYFLENGVDIKATDNDGKNVLHYSLSRSGASQMIDYYIKNGVDVNSPDNSGKTPLMYAAEGWEGPVLTLLENGANINAVDNSGRTALMYACIAGDQSELIHLFIENGADANIADESGKTALMYACKNFKNEGIEVTVSELLKGNADINKVDNEGRSAVFYLFEHWGYCDYGNKVATILAKNGADFNIRDNNGRTPLMVLCEGKNSNDFCDIVPLIKKYGADMNAKDNNGKTALVYLADGPSPSAKEFETLLNCGATDGVDEAYNIIKKHKYIGNSTKKEILNILEKYM
ncbi:MAG: ankyrin repeat domain-containing protein [Oscillospiraceae bacterium]